MNRHNALVVIGIATLAIGAIAGTGALTQVSAERTANVQVAGDSSAMVSLTPNSSLITTTSAPSGEASVLQINLDNVNENATTTIEPAFSVRNEVGSSITLNISAYDATGSEVTSGISIAAQDSTDAYQNIQGGSTVSVATQTTTNVRLVFDTSGVGADALDSITYIEVTASA